MTHRTHSLRHRPARRTGDLDAEQLPPVLDAPSTTEHASSPTTATTSARSTSTTPKDRRSPPCGATPTGDGWTLHITEHGAPLALAADTARLRELTGAAQAAIEEAERSTEADTMDAVFEARDGAVDALRALLAALTPPAS
ncbi:hypothetical protein AB1285_26895 [Microbacterium sp. NRRL B-14842]|uniref:hypothetical protein n=1 Tax=Microbacterium sp. NRRL B-14842 TaxID=3162881 RepID=UPI003D2D2EE9